MPILAPSRLPVKVAALRANRNFMFLARLNRNVQKNYVSLIAAGLAFYSLLAVFPALAATVSLCGLFFKPTFVADQLKGYARFLPPQSFAILFDQAESLALSDKNVLGFSLIFSILLAVYSATKGVRALMGGLNMVFGQIEDRTAVRFYATAFGLTALLTVYFLVAMTAVAGIPILLRFIWLPAFMANIINFVRWPLLFVFALFGLELLYRFAPSHMPYRNVRLWSAGSAMATLLWLVGSSVFSLFVSNFGRYNQTYGSIGAVIILLTWFWMNGYLILVGAQINVTLTERTRLADH